MDAFNDRMLPGAERIELAGMDAFNGRMLLGGRHRCFSMIARCSEANVIKLAGMDALNDRTLLGTEGY